MIARCAEPDVSSTFRSKSRGRTCTLCAVQINFWACAARVGADQGHMGKPDLLHFPSRRRVASPGRCLLPLLFCTVCRCRTGVVLMEARGCARTSGSIPGSDTPQASAWPESGRSLVPTSAEVASPIAGGNFFRSMRGRTSPLRHAAQQSGGPPPHGCRTCQLCPCLQSRKAGRIPRKRDAAALVQCAST
jgi:hypothetical protein